MKYRKFQKQDYARAALHDGLIGAHDTGLGKSLFAYTWGLLKCGYQVSEPQTFLTPVTPVERRGSSVEGRKDSRLSTLDSRPSTIAPKAPVLLIVPGGLHEQLALEGAQKFHVETFPLDSQDAFMRLNTGANGLPRLTEDGRPIIPPGFYITSYSQISSNGVSKMPDPLDWEPRQLLEWLCLKSRESKVESRAELTDKARENIIKVNELATRGIDGEKTAAVEKLNLLLEKYGATLEEVLHYKNAGSTATNSSLPSFFANRRKVWRDDFDRFRILPDHTLNDLDRVYQEAIAKLDDYYQDERAAESDRRKLEASYQVLKNLLTLKPNCSYDDLTTHQQDFVIREFLVHKIAEYEQGVGETRSYPIGPETATNSPSPWGEGRGEGAQQTERSPSPQSSPPGEEEKKNARPHLNPLPQGEEAKDTRPQWKIKCVYSPSLADHCYNAFDCVVIDEGVHMKGEETIVGQAVRSMDPLYRLVLSATPVKNRLPDIFRLAWWAAGGKMEAHARFPYRDDPSERQTFVETFMVSERNVSKEEASKRSGNARYRRFTPEVCNVHRLWKLLGPIVLRRRKQDCGEEIVPKIRKVVRCQMGHHQKKVYKYHLDATYKDKNGDEAIGARLQALRIAAAEPGSVSHLQNKGEVHENCPECKEREREKVRKGESETDLTHPLTHSPAHSLTRKHAVYHCQTCKGKGTVPLPHVSPFSYIPKTATTLTLIAEILERKEQVVVFSAFNDPLDTISKHLREASVRHITLDGRVSQKKRGDEAILFQKGRFESRDESRETKDSTLDPRPSTSIPVMLAGVECMSEGYSFDLANNVILIAYSWAYDKFIQALNRVHRMTSLKPVNVYVVLCEGTIDRKLESLIQEKGDAAELVLDGQLIGERTEEVNLGELLKIARQEFNEAENTLDEAVLLRDWPNLRASLSLAAGRWTEGAAREVSEKVSKGESESAPTHPRTHAPAPTRARSERRGVAKLPPIHPALLPPAEIIFLEPEPENIIELPTQAIAYRPSPIAPTPNEAWRLRMKERAARLRMSARTDIWAEL